MNQNNLAKTRFKVQNVFSFLRVLYYKTLGLKVGEPVMLGKIHCEWPGSLSIGDHCTIRDDVSFWIKNPFHTDNYIRIGNSVFIGRSSEFNCSLRITIGNKSLIASNTILADINHTIEKESLIKDQPVVAEEIVIGDDVWIGTGCTILKGVSIGRGSVIGAGAVVTRSVPEYEIWAGVPVRKIGCR